MAMIRVLDGQEVPNAEDLAMLQALYSRSAESVDVHLEKVKKAGSGRFMSQYYVGYGHRSIADCGTTTLFFEGVSLLAAKAIQDWPLYSGQETSTRYIDMSKQEIIDPVGTPESANILNAWMQFYTQNQDRVAAHTRTRYPMREGEDAAVYERAVKARTFDVLRAFLPAGICTQLSWHTNLRQAWDHLQFLERHPAAEIASLGKTSLAALHARYASSGFDQTQPDRDANSWMDYTASEIAYCRYYPTNNRSTIDPHTLQAFESLFRMRPRGQVLPHFLTALGQLTFTFPLDFGSFRDLQRHRNGVCRMPLLTPGMGFEEWYLDQLDLQLRIEAEVLVRQQRDAIFRLRASDFAKQYYVGLGFRVPCAVTYGLPAAVYVLELRSGKLVHPTLRKAVLSSMLPYFRSAAPGVNLHVDEAPSDWDVRRGAQTITEKTA